MKKSEIGPAANLQNDLLAQLIEGYSLENMLASLFNDKDDCSKFVNSCKNANDDQLDQILNDVLWEKIKEQRQMFQLLPFHQLGLDFDTYASGCMLAVKINFSEKTKVEEFTKDFFKEFTGDYNDCIQKLKSHALKCMTGSQERPDSKKCYEVTKELTRYRIVLEQKFLPYNIEKMWINAIVKDDVDSCRIFLNQYDVDINKKTSRALGNLKIKEDWSPIYIALKKRSSNVLKLFLESSEIDHENVKYYFRKFCLEGKPFNVKIFIDKYKHFESDFLQNIMNTIIQPEQDNQDLSSKIKVLTLISRHEDVPDSIKYVLLRNSEAYLSSSLCTNHDYIELLKQEKAKLSPYVFFYQFYKGAAYKVLYDIYTLTDTKKSFAVDELGKLIQNNQKKLPNLLNNFIQRMPTNDDANGETMLCAGYILTEMFVLFTQDTQMFIEVYGILVEKFLEKMGLKYFSFHTEQILKNYEAAGPRLRLAAYVYGGIDVAGMDESYCESFSKMINAGFGLGYNDETDMACVESIRNAYLLSKPDIETDSMFEEGRWNAIYIWGIIQGLSSLNSFTASLRCLLDDFNGASLNRYLSFFPKTKQSSIYGDDPKLYDSIFDLNTSTTEGADGIVAFINRLEYPSVDVALIYLQTAFALYLMNFLESSDIEAIRGNLSKFILAYSEHTNLFFLSPQISMCQFREIELYHDAYKQSSEQGYDLLKLFQKIGQPGLKYLASEKQLAPNPLNFKELFDVLINGGDFSTLDAVLKNYEISGAKLYESNPSIINSISNLSSFFYHSPVRCCGYVYAAIKAMIIPAVSGLFNMKGNAVLSEVFKTDKGDCSCCDVDVLDAEKGHRAVPGHTHT